MRLAVLPVAMLACLPSLVRAQSVPPSIAKAEAEGAGFAHADPATSVQSVFALPFGGSSDRRCGRMPSTPLPNGSWRSSDFIIRAVVSYSLGLQAGKGHKILWIPLHGATLRGTPLLLRAVRVGHPADSLRLSFVGLARANEAAGPLYGYPTAVLFPSAGQWVVVATAKDDWGCFVLDVDETTHEHG